MNSTVDVVPVRSESTADPHSQANPWQVRIDHLHLQLTVDFNEQILRGRASLRIEQLDPRAALWLDTRDLTIEAVRFDDDASPAPFVLEEADPLLGSRLTIPLLGPTRFVHIDYSTHPGAPALQWLSPEQTAGGTRPYLYSQNQPIGARSWIPCQDSPAVRQTYSARLRVPRELRAVMSAVNPPGRAADGVYEFRMPQRVPSYLIALAVGEIAFRPLDGRSGVWAEPREVQRAAAEFTQIPAMMQAAEELFGPYAWEQYDVLVLPPSFPMGGMENPRLTFATPTILAGDRSLVSLIAHELAHSWTGNLVTNAAWGDLWLNEGFTTYAERRIMEALEGAEYADMLWQLGAADLARDLATLPPADTRLRLDLADRDPDLAFSDVPYEKGALFLRTLEEAVGREAWDGFLRAMIDAWRFRSVDTATFRTRLVRELLGPQGLDPAAVHLDAWLDGAGIPPGTVAVESARLARVEQFVRVWRAGTPLEELPTERWSAHEWLHFLRSLPSDLSASEMAALDAAAGFSRSGNSEILAQWLERAIRARYGAADPVLEDFLRTVGRRKFLRPLYGALLGVAGGRERARRIYADARPRYHSLAQHSLDELLGGPPPPTAP